MTTVLPLKPQIITREDKPNKFKISYVNYNKITHQSFETKVEAENFIKTINTNPIDISVTDFINSTSTYKRWVYGYHVGVNFNNDGVELPIDPYLLGYWLGDGHSTGSQITTADNEIIEKLNKCLKK